jgi:hypothetical protein
MVGPIPIQLSVGLWAGYDFNYQFQFCVLNRPPGFIAGFGASASVYARASAAVSLLVVRGGVSIDLAIFDGSLSPKLTLDLKQVCAKADLSISALSGHIDAWYETRGCGPWYRAYTDWCGAKSLTLLSWNGPAIKFNYPSSPCYPILGLPSKAIFALPSSEESTSSWSHPSAMSNTSDIDVGAVVAIQYAGVDCPPGNLPITGFTSNFDDVKKIPTRTAYTQFSNRATGVTLWPGGKRPNFKQCSTNQVAANNQAKDSDYINSGWSRVTT